MFKPFRELLILCIIPHAHACDEYRVCDRFMFFGGMFVRVLPKGTQNARIGV